MDDLNVGDTISRQTVIDMLEGRIQANGYSNVALVSELNRSIGYVMRMPSADVIPVAWIEEQITWLMGTGNGPAALTAVSISSLLNRWRDEAKDFKRKE